MAKYYRDDLTEHEAKMLAMGRLVEGERGEGRQFRHDMEANGFATYDSVKNIMIPTERGKVAMGVHGITFNEVRIDRLFYEAALSPKD